jgi:2'-5' RNA ligase
MTVSDGMRAFVALTLAPEVEQAVAEFIESMRTARTTRSDGIRWTSRNKLHLTLRFLGNGVAASTLERLAGALEEIANGTACFAIGVRGLGVFPNLSRPRVIWIGLESAELSALANDVERAAVAAGIVPERRTFAAHLTIARVRDLNGWSELRHAIETAQAPDFGHSLVRSLILYRSILQSDSSVYEELARYRFARAG